MNNFAKDVVPVRIPAGGRFSSPVWVTIKFDGGRVSMTGVVGPLKCGDAVGSCGQCSYALLHADRKLMQGWTAEMVGTLYDVWDRWHLNDMRAGSPRQEELLRGLRLPYEDSCKLLAQNELLHDTEFWWDYKAHKQYIPTEYANPDARPYLYGTAHMHEPIPQEVYDFLVSLPDAGKPHPWA